jgi:DNA-binding response OmpR family regulator
MKTEKLLVVESDDALKQDIVAVLSDAGYEVSADYREGMKAILAFNPDAVVLGANPPRLDCRDLRHTLGAPTHAGDDGRHGCA